MFLSAATCISVQPTFLQDDPWGSLVEINAESKLIEPNYKEYAPSNALRRMSTALKMGVATGQACLKTAGTGQTDAIIVGTGLGCVQDTLRFLKTVYQGQELMLSPTAFIQSTHNSIAGQLALILGNHNYNMTHVQQNMSLGHALLDAELLIAEKDAETVLVGAVDEKTDELMELLGQLAERTGFMLPLIGQGAAFFLASADERQSSAQMTGLELSPTLPEGSSADLVLSNDASQWENAFDYTAFSGEHFSSVGFGLFLALKALEQGKVDCRHLRFAGIHKVMVHHKLFGTEMSIMLER